MVGSACGNRRENGYANRLSPVLLPAGGIEMGKRPHGAMPRVTVVSPRMNARVRIGGRAFWLGRCPDGKVTAEQSARAARIWQEFLSSGASNLPLSDRASTATDPLPVATAAPVPLPPAAGLTVAELGLKYLDHCNAYFRKADGSVTSSVAGAEMSLRALFLFADVAASEFGPKSLKLVRDALVREGRPRATCNRVIKTIRRIFKWGLSEELVSPDVWHSLQAVAALQKGRTEAPELPPVEEVPGSVVEETLRYASTVVGAMIQLQRWTGARPGEVCLVRPCDIERSGDVWVYSPEYHKLSWRENSLPRRIAIGGEGQRILGPYLLCSPSAYCFSPQEAELERAQQRRRKRKSPMTPSQQARKPKRDGDRRPRERYDTASYRRAIARAVDAANKARKASGTEEELMGWAPNQLRHLRAGEVEVACGIEAANAVLGHANIRTTEIYAKRKLQIAISVAREIG